jgi:hypothetical protein
LIEDMTMEQTYITDNLGNPIPMGTERDPSAALHFALIGRVQDGTVWQASEIVGRGMRTRLTFTSYYTDESQTGHPMAWLLFRQMLAHEATARWEAELSAQQACAA